MSTPGAAVPYIQRTQRTRRRATRVVALPDGYRAETVADTVIAYLS